MALVTWHSLEQPGMISRLTMAGRTRRREIGKGVVQVALGTCQVGMRTREWKSCLGVVEGGWQPCCCGVACAAISAELAVMCIILGMARIAGSIQSRKNAIDVALGAIQCQVCTREGKIRLGMVKCRGQPGRGIVAGIAKSPKLTFMGVILGMAGIARRIQGNKNVVQVALCAWQAGMSARQREF